MKAAPAAPAAAEKPAPVEEKKVPAKEAATLDKAPEGHAAPAGCATASQPPASKPVVLQRDGKQVVHGGEGFTELPVVSVTELVKNPEPYADKDIEISGDVAGMCYHARGWFSVAAADGSGAQVRATTMPRFKVPRNAVGTKARVQGRVELIDVDPRFAKHLAKDHGMPEPEKADQPVKRVVLRVSGAEFAEPKTP